MEIELDLSKYCVETAMKRTYNRLISAYFRSKGNDIELESKLSMLQDALNRFDFPALRTMHGDLAGNSGAGVVLTDNGDGVLDICVDGVSVDAVCCDRK